MTTYTKAVIEADKKHILNRYATARTFYNDVLAHRRIYLDEYPRTHPNGYTLIKWMCINGFGEFLTTTSEMERYLAKTIPDYSPARMRYKNGNIRADKIINLYASLMARDGAKILDKIDMDRFLDGKEPNFW